MATYMVTGEEKKPQLPTPAAGPRPGKGPMKDSELQRLFGGLVEASKQYVDAELSPDRTLASKYYKGEPFGNEETGRSQFVVTEVRDGILGVIPGMLKVVFGPEHAVEFRPTSSEDVDLASQQTDYVRMVFEQDNPGFMHTLANIKDGLIKKTGIWKWWWDDTTDVTNHKVEGVDQEALEILAGDEEVELTRVEQTGEVDGPPPPPEQPGQPPAPPQKIPVYTAEFTRTRKDGRARFGTVPPEEVLLLRDTRSQDDALFIGHRTRKTDGELLAMGVPQDVIDEHGGDDTSIKENQEAIERQFNQTTNQEPEAGEANQKNLYIEGYARIDYDGDGIPELRKICAIGPGFHVVDKDPIDHVPLAIWCPDPEPHTIVGQSYADRLMDIQRYKSMLFRGISDSMAASIFPRTWYKEGDANLADVLNTAIGAPIRTKSGPNAVGEFAHTFLGKDGFDLLNYTDDMVEKRTGRPNGAAGIDADALQSSTQTAVAATVTASQAQQEMLVRIFAECALKPLFRGLLRLLVTHQPRARMVRLRNAWVSVDPREWDAEMDVQVNVALGTGFTEEKVQTLLDISAKQAEILAAEGPDNPIVGYKQYRDTLAEMAELRGKKDTSRYFKPISQQQEDQMAQQRAAQPPQKSPEQQEAEAKIQMEQQKMQAEDQRETMRTQREFTLKQADLALKLKESQLSDERERLKQMAEDDRERDRLASDFQFKMMDLELKYGVKLNELDMKQQVDLIRHTVAAGPADSSEEGAPAPAKKRRRVTVHRADPNDPRSPVVGATVEDDDGDSE